MDFDDGNWAYRGSVSVSGGGGSYPSPWSFEKKNIAIELTMLGQKSTWYRGGYVQFVSNGLTIPHPDPLGFGRTTLTAPNFPESKSYKVNFTPVRWVQRGRLRYWEFLPTRASERPEPVNPKEFTARELQLITSAGLNPDKLRLSPESLEVVLPLLAALKASQSSIDFTNLEKLIKDFKVMATTDIKTILGGMDAISTQSMANATAIATQGTTLATIATSAVSEKIIALNKAQFQLNNGFWNAAVEHNLGTRFPGISVYDNDGDLQLVEFVAINENSGRLVLTASQYNDNNYPLTVNLQGRNVAIVSPSAPSLPLGSGFSARFSSGAVEVSRPDGTKFNLETAGSIIEAYSLNGFIHTLDTNGSYWYYPQPDFVKNGSNSGNWATVLSTGTVLPA